MLKGKDIIHTRDFTKQDMDRIFDVADEFKPLWEKRKEGTKLLEGKVLGTLFFQESTRTQFSFQAAMLKLGGGYVGWSGTEATSYSKGEEFTEGIRILDKFVDIIAIRHPEEGSAQIAADVAEVPVMNCGDGTQHPIHVPDVLYTIKKIKDKISDLNVAIMGDLKNQRVAHSVVYGLAMYGANIILVSPEELKMPESIIEELKERYDANIMLMNVVDSIEVADVFYSVPIRPTIRLGIGIESEMRRTLSQFAKPQDFFQSKATYMVTMNMLKAHAKEDLLVLTPGPRMDALPPDIDGTKYYGYWEMYTNAVPLRMAILSLILGAK